MGLGPGRRSGQFGSRRLALDSSLAVVGCLPGPFGKRQRGRLELQYLVLRITDYLNIAYQWRQRRKGRRFSFLLLVIDDEEEIRVSWRFQNPDANFIIRMRQSTAGLNTVLLMFTACATV